MLRTRRPEDTVLQKRGELWVPEEEFEIAFVVRIKHGRLYKLLREKGWSQAEFARQLGVHPMVVSNWMLLKRSPRDAGVLRKLMEITGESPFDLFPQFMCEDDWRKHRAELPREWALVREVEVKQLLGGKVLALPSAEDEYAARELEERVRESLQFLTVREAEILRMHFGIGESNHTLKKIGEKLGIGKERVRQLEVLALRKLRGFRHDGKGVPPPLAELHDR